MAQLVDPADLVANATEFVLMSGQGLSETQLAQFLKTDRTQIKKIREKLLLNSSIIFEEREKKFMTRQCFQMLQRRREEEARPPRIYMPGVPRDQVIAQAYKIIGEYSGLSRDALSEKLGRDILGVQADLLRTHKDVLITTRAVRKKGSTYARMQYWLEKDLPWEYRIILKRNGVLE
jgi:hypothetical protein